MAPKLISAQTWQNNDKEQRITTRWQDDLGLQFNALHDENGRVLANPRHFKALRLTPEQLAAAKPLETRHPAYDLAEKGAAASPDLAERMTKAADLVAAGKVITHKPNDLDLIGTVLSSSHYSITAKSCTCPDFKHRGGWCKHRLAVRMAVALDQPPGEIPFTSDAAVQAREHAAQDRMRAQVDAAARRDQQSWNRYCSSQYGAERYIIKAMGNGAKTVRPDIAHRAGITKK